MSEETVLKNINVRRMLNIISAGISEALDKNLFEPNNYVAPTMWEHVTHQAATVWAADPGARIVVKGKDYFKDDIASYVDKVIEIMKTGEDAQVDVYLKVVPVTQIVTFRATVTPDGMEIDNA